MGVILGRFFEACLNPGEGTVQGVGHPGSLFEPYLSLVKAGNKMGVVGGTFLSYIIPGEGREQKGRWFWATFCSLRYHW